MTDRNINLDELKARITHTPIQALSSGPSKDVLAILNRILDQNAQILKTLESPTPVIPDTEMGYKDDIIVEFIIKTQSLAYKNDLGVCCFCGGGRHYGVGDRSGLWTPEHSGDCLFTRAKVGILRLDRDWYKVEETPGIATHINRPGVKVTFRQNVLYCNRYATAEANLDCVKRALCELMGLTLVELELEIGDFGMKVDPYRSVGK